MAKVFKVNAPDTIWDVSHFCLMCSENLEYLGRFVNAKTHEVYPGDIISFEGKFYTTETATSSGMSSYTEDDGTWTTVISPFECFFPPVGYIPLEKCAIRIELWDTRINDEGRIGEWAYLAEEVPEARKLVRTHPNADFTIQILGIDVRMEDFINPIW